MHVHAGKMKAGEGAGGSGGVNATPAGERSLPRLAAGEGGAASPNVFAKGQVCQHSLRPADSVTATDEGRYWLCCFIT